MTRRPAPRTTRRPALLAATLLGAAALALTGCSAGAVTQTDTTVSSVIGSEGQTGSVLLRDITLDPGPEVVVPAGSTVTLGGTLVNVDFQADQLVSVSSPYFAQVRTEGTTAIPGDSATRMVGSQPGPVGPPTNPATSGSMRVTMVGAAQVLHAGPTYPVTFTFARGGSITLPVPVQTTNPVPAS